MKIPKIIAITVRNNLCIGCGLCIYVCPSKALKMQWDEHGFLVPQLSGSCDLNGDCLKVCPFNPFPEEAVRTESNLADLFLVDSQNFHPKIGKYNTIYAGYANEFRLSSSSGGIGTYIFTKLLTRGIVDFVFSVKESQKQDVHYEYAICSTKEELLQASKTKYYPVTLAKVMSELKNLEGKVAIVGVACFIKSIRLAQFYDPALNEKIPFLVGIICGGVKSKSFTEYLSSKAGVEKQNIQTPQFRIKDLYSTASDYSYGCTDKASQQNKTIKMRTLHDMWGTGLFKANACDFCDDVTTELADISLGDAWLPPYKKEGRGTNVVVARSALAQQLIEEGIKNKSLTIDDLPLARFLTSQQGSFNHRHLGLSARIKLVQKNKQSLPPKRFANEKVTFDFKVVQKMRMKVRQKSLGIWEKSPSAETFDKKMKKHLKQLKLATKVYHYRRAIERRVLSLINKS